MEVISINNNYSSALRRLAAWFIDSLLVGTLITITFSWGDDSATTFYNIDHFHFRYLFSFYRLLHFVIALLYFALMESSKYQGTLGKIVMGIKVVGYRNERIEFSKALLRNLSKVLSGFILAIGYIMIIFDDRKQGLHDKIADTFVVKN